MNLEPCKFIEHLKNESENKDKNEIVENESSVCSGKTFS